MKKIWDSTHQKQRIDNWKQNGVIYKSNSVEDWKELYYIHMGVTHCPSCSVELVGGGRVSNSRCLDHDHSTGEYRNTICNACNTKTERDPNITNTSGWKNIHLQKTKYKGKINSIGWLYNRGGFKTKGSQSLSELLVRSFFNELKHLRKMKYNSSE
jgi:hypothetical protein